MVNKTVMAHTCFLDCLIQKSPRLCFFAFLTTLCLPKRPKFISVSVEKSPHPKLKLYSSDKTNSKLSLSVIPRPPLNNKPKAKNRPRATHNEKNHPPTTFFTRSPASHLRAEGNRRLQQQQNRHSCEILAPPQRFVSGTAKSIHPGSTSP